MAAIVVEQQRAQDPADHRPGDRARARRSCSRHRAPRCWPTARRSSAISALPAGNCDFETFESFEKAFTADRPLFQHPTTAHPKHAPSGGNDGRSDGRRLRPARQRLEWMLEAVGTAEPTMTGSSLGGPRTSRPAHDHQADLEVRGPMRRRTLLVSAAATLAAPTFARAQNPPAGPVRLIHGYDAGSNPDTIARHLAPG